MKILLIIFLYVFFACTGVAESNNFSNISVQTEVEEYLTKLSQRVATSYYLPDDIRKMVLFEQSRNPHWDNKKIFSDIPPNVHPFYRPTFRIPYILIPVDSPEIKTYVGKIATNIKNKIFVKAPSGTKIRYFIHPNSLDFHKVWIDKFGGVKGYFWATPTSSSRSLFIWEDMEKIGSINNPIFIVKVPLDVRVFGYRRLFHPKLSRAGVPISSLFQSMNPDELLENKTGIFAETFSLYSVNNNLEIRTYTDKNCKKNPKKIYAENGTVINENLIKELGLNDNQHKEIDCDKVVQQGSGMIVRELPFPYQTNEVPGNRLIFPLYALMGINKVDTTKEGREPFLITLFRHAKAINGKLSFDDFMKHNILKPIAESFGHLHLYQGIYFEAHTQNVVVEVDMVKGEIIRLMHRDFSQTSVDIGMRLARGLPSEDLASNEYASIDYLFAKKYDPYQPISGYLFPYLFGTGKNNIEHFYNNNTYEPFIGMHFKDRDDYIKKFKNHYNHVLLDLMIEECRKYFGNDVVANVHKISKKKRDIIRNARSEFLKSKHVTREKIMSEIERISFVKSFLPKIYFPQQGRAKKNFG